MQDETLDDTVASGDERDRPAVPGMLVVWAQHAPRCVVLRGLPCELGRDELRALGLADDRVSRRHARIERVGRAWRITDLGSRNGTYVDGVRCAGQVSREGPAVVRVGQTVLLPVDAVEPFLDGVARRDGVVVGPTLGAALARVEALARSGSHVLLQGPSGAGKEVAARLYHHAACGPRAAMISVNCATIPREIAERLLFGARRGAFTGATDAEGLVQQADGGTLFLDEVVELEPSVQAKLLRVLETGAVTPLGATKPVAVRFRLCSATHRDLRDAVRADRFREDLFFRLGRPAVRIPPLAERREEIAYLLVQSLGALGPSAPRCTAAFVEACLLRAWPGNVRELSAEVRAAGLLAIAARRDLDADALDPSAGVALNPTEPADRDDDATADSPTPERPLVWDALVARKGNVAQAAQALGLSRARLRRLIARWNLDVDSLREP